MFTLLSLFIWEYHRNPDWFNRPQLDTLNPDSELTSEEQARLSEIDTLDLLLRSMPVEKGTDASPSFIEPNSSEFEGSSLAGNEPADSASDRSLAGRDNPFAIYEDQYRFPGSQFSSQSNSDPSLGLSSEQSSIITRPSLIRPSLTNSSPLYGSPLSGGTFKAETAQPSTASPTSINSALSEALSRQQSVRQNDREGGRPNVTESPLERPSSGLPSGIDNSNGIDNLNIDRNAYRDIGNTQSSVTPSQQTPSNQIPSSQVPSSQVPSNSISVPFIRTTPEMSPPSGTTGYQVPASNDLPVFNLPSQQPTRSSPPQSLQIPPTRLTTPTTTTTPTVPTVNYTAPRFTQPEQNSRRR